MRIRPVLFPASRSLLPVLLFSLVLPALPLAAQQKYALVIGNGAYTKIGRLNNPLNDADDVASTLQGYGWTVDRVRNGTLSEMMTAVTRFRNRLAGSPGSYGFFYYAGHGVQYNGENYLIPVDVDIPSGNYLRQMALSVQTALDELNDAGNALNVVILDACRNNPFSWARDGTRGLQVVGQQPADSIIIFATGAGAVAADGEGRNGLFTTHLLNNLRTPGLEATELFRRTGGDVARASGNAQRPEIHSKFYGTAILGAPAAARVTPAPAPAAQAPAAPRNLRAGTPGAGSVRLDWDGAGADLQYRVWYNTRNDPATATALTRLVSGTSTNVTGYSGEGNLYLWVTALSGTLESAKSGVVTVAIAAAQPPAVPRNLRAGTPGTDRVRLDWDSAGAGVQYRVWVNTRNDPASARAFSHLDTVTARNITELQSGTTYYFWVTALSGTLESAKSGAVTVAIAAATPSPTPISVPAEAADFFGTWKTGSGTTLVISATEQALANNSNSLNVVHTSWTRMTRQDIASMEIHWGGDDDSHSTNGYKIDGIITAKTGTGWTSLRSLTIGSRYSQQFRLSADKQRLLVSPGGWSFIRQ